MASNPFRGEVTVQIGGVDRIVRVSWVELAQLRGKFGPDYGDAVEKAFKDPLDFGAIADILAIVFTKHWPEVNRDMILEISPGIGELAQILSGLVKAKNLCHYGIGEVAPDVQNPTGEVKKKGTS